MKKLLIFVLMFMVSACYYQGKRIQDIFINKDYVSGKAHPNPPIAKENVVVCRDKQCAPASLSMSKEYIYNSLFQLFENNNKSTALICQASPNSHACVENYITLPIKVGITPASMYIDSVKISDVNVTKNHQGLNLLLNYNVTFNGQSPECTTSNTLVYAKSSEHIILEDSAYQCQMTTLGKTSVKTIFAIDYIDLDYGYIGGYYSIGLSGPAYGGGVGYMILRLQKDAFPLSPVLKAPVQKAKKTNPYANTNTPNTDVKIFPIKSK